MDETTVEKANIQPNEPRDATRGNLPPKKSHLLRWVLFAVIAFAVVLAVFLGLIQKWLWMRELDYVGIFWTLLSVKWGMFGAALVFGISISVDQSPICSQEHRHFTGTHALPARLSLPPPMQAEESTSISAPSC